MSSFCQGFQVEQAQMWEQALPALRKDSSLHELCAPAKPKLLHLLLVSLEHGLRLRTCLQNTTHRYHKLSSQQYALSFIYIFTTWYSTVKNNRIYVIITNFSLLCNSIYRPLSSNAAHSSVTHLKKIKIKIRQHIWNYIERGQKNYSTSEAYCFHQRAPNMTFRTTSKAERRTVVQVPRLLQFGQGDGLPCCKNNLSILVKEKKSSLNWGIEKQYI